MNRPHLMKNLVGTSLAAGVLTSGSAHAQVVIENFNGVSVSEPVNGGDPGNQYFGFNLDPLGALINPSSGYEFDLDTAGVFTSASPKLEGDSGTDYTAQVSSTALAANTTVGSSTSFGDLYATADGADQYYGLSLVNSSGTYYGYVKFTQTTDSTNVTETLETLAVQQTPGASITTGATPEPSTMSLLACGAMGAAGLMAYRRRATA